MKTPSPALAVATLALAVALTGTASATGLLDGHSIRDHSIPASKLMLHSVTSKQVKQHSLTKLALDPNAVTIVNNVNAPAGPQGDPGAQGAPGVAVVDPKRIVTATGQDAITHSGSSAGSEAICPAGTYVIGGGYTSLGSFVNAPVSVTETGTATDGSNGWYVNTHNYGGADQQTPWHAIAYCAPSA